MCAEVGKRSQCTDVYSLLMIPSLPKNETLYRTHFNDAKKESKADWEQWCPLIPNNTVA